MVVVHYAEGTERRHALPTHGICTHPILANNWTSNPDDVTCSGCMWMVFALLQEQQNRILERFKVLASKVKEDTLKEVNEQVSGTRLGKPDKR